jgi:sugar lactone lactonase YvrE
MKQGIARLFGIFVGVVTCGLTPSSADAGTLYFSTTPRTPSGHGSNGSIQKVDLDGSNYGVVLEAGDYSVDGNGYPNGYIRGLALDLDAKKIYFTDQNSDAIRRSDLTGGNVEVLVSGAEWGLTPHGIELDLSNNKMYWSDSGSGGILRANLDGSSVEFIVTKNPQTIGSVEGGIALDRTNGKIYFGSHLEGGSYWVNRANLDGSNIETLMKGVRANDFAVDESGGFLYWVEWPADGSLHEILPAYIPLFGINRVALDRPGAGATSNKEYILTGAFHSLALIDNRIYCTEDWVPYGTGAIRSANVDGSNQVTILTGLPGTATLHHENKPQFITGFISLDATAPTVSSVTCYHERVRFS